MDLSDVRDRIQEFEVEIVKWLPDLEWTVEAERTKVSFRAANVDIALVFTWTSVLIPAVKADPEADPPIEGVPAVAGWYGSAHGNPRLTEVDLETVIKSTAGAARTVSQARSAAHIDTVSKITVL